MRGFLIMVIIQCLGFLACQTVEDSRPSIPFAQGGDPPLARRFLVEGPFEVEEHEDFEILLAPEQEVMVDLFLPHEPGKRAPLVFLQHGNHSDKEAHLHQAKLLASWGVYVVVPDFPAFQVWRQNGKTLADLVDKIKSWPRTIGLEHSQRPIFLVGHSFGGSAVAVASFHTKVRGLVLLDPALVHTDVTKLLPKLKAPAILLGADPSLYRAKGRHLWHKRYGGPFFELTLQGADHNDAQDPTMLEVYFGFDPFASSLHQQRFGALLALSLAVLLKDPQLKKPRDYFEKAPLDRWWVAPRRSELPPMMVFVPEDGAPE